MAIALPVGLPAAYALARFGFLGANVLRLSVVGTRAFPIIILAIPLAATFISWGIDDSIYAVSFLHAALARNGVESIGRSGLNVWIPVQDEQRVVAAVAAAGFAIRAGEPFRLEAPISDRVVLGVIVIFAATSGLIDDVPIVSPPLHALSLAIAQKCNLGCTYCYASANDRPKVMTWETAKSGRALKKMSCWMSFKFRLLVNARPSKGKLAPDGAYETPPRNSFSRLGRMVHV